MEDIESQSRMTESELEEAGDESNVAGALFGRSFDFLPYSAVYRILEFLQGGDLAIASAVNKTFLDIANKIVYKAFISLEKVIAEELAVLKDEIEMFQNIDEFVPIKIIFMRSHFVCELMRGEISMVKAACRWTFETKPFCAGHLLQEYREVFQKAKSRSLPLWQFHDERTTKIQHFSKMFIDRKVHTVGHELLGVKILDILESLIPKQYRIIVRYQPADGICNVQATYLLRNPVYLNKPPRLGNQNRSVPTTEEAKRIVGFLINVVRINNRMTLRQEMYSREIEATHRAHEIVDIDFGFELVPEVGWMSKEVRSYPETYSNPIRTIVELDDETAEISEEYKSEEFFTSASLSSRGLECIIQLECPIEKGPYFVIKRWEELKKEIISAEAEEPGWRLLKKYAQDEKFDFHDGSVSIASTQEGGCDIETTSCQEEHYLMSGSLEVILQVTRTEVGVHRLCFTDPE